jgi:hypothetical protein
LRALCPFYVCETRLILPGKPRGLEQWRR